jgi:hypothetical protein
MAQLPVLAPFSSTAELSGVLGNQIPYYRNSTVPDAEMRFLKIELI